MKSKITKVVRTPSYILNYFTSPGQINHFCSIERTCRMTNGNTERERFLFLSSSHNLQWPFYTLFQLPNPCIPVLHLETSVLTLPTQWQAADPASNSPSTNSTETQLLVKFIEDRKGTKNQVSSIFKGRQREHTVQSTDS